MEAEPPDPALMQIKTGGFPTRTGEAISISWNLFAGRERDRVETRARSLLLRPPIG